MKVCFACRIAKEASAYYVHKSAKDGLYPTCKDCERERRRAWRERNPEEVAARAARKHAYDLEYYKRNKDRISARECQKYAQKRDQTIERARQWSAENRARRRAIASSYKARRKQVEAAGATSAEVAEWLMTQRMVCFWCDNACADDFHIDHFHPLARGGKHEVSNLVVACPTCNHRKNAKDPERFMIEILEAA